MKKQLLLMSAFCSSIALGQTSTKYTGKIYEIPVVVHIIESSYDNYTVNPIKNSDLKVTDEQIKQWIDNTNAIYATTRGGIFPREGNGLEDGTIMPFKLVLAKRDQNGQPTTGIYRYDGDIFPNYGKFGVRHAISDPNYGPSGNDIKAKYPHWDEKRYYNIYVVIGVDGAFVEGGATGFAGMPSFGDGGYEAFIRVNAAKLENSVTLAHEFGHSLGLNHTFESSNCPTGNDDGIDDTEPIVNGAVIKDPTDPNDVSKWRVPTNQDINPCTGKNYQGTQYNIMGYGYKVVKFTPGQREVAIREFLKHRKSLTYSTGGTQPTTDNEVVLKSTTCFPKKSYTSPSDVGISWVKFGTIDNETSVKDGAYVDYATKNQALFNNVFTDIQAEKPETLTIKGGGGGHNISVWIDYNNNGKFEAKEKIANEEVNATNSSFTMAVTPPTDAVKDTYLRMRVKADWWEDTACSDLEGGQVEDYAVRIVSPKAETPVAPVEQVYKYRVGINTETPQATLDIKEKTDAQPTYSQGVVFPSFTDTERAAFTNIKEGTMIYNKTQKCLEIYINGVWKCINYKN